jgi:hypothetical protein
MLNKSFPVKQHANIIGNILVNNQQNAHHFWTFKTNIFTM